MRRAINPKGRGVWILGRELVAHRFLKGILGNEIAALTGKQAHQRDLVVLIGLDLELAAVMPVRKEILVELRYLEGTAKQVRITHPDILHEPAKHAIEVIHEIHS